MKLHFNITTFVLPAVLCASLLSCRKEIKFKGDETKPVLVLNAVVETDSLFTVYLERSSFFLEQNTNPEYLYIASGATVTVKNLSTGATFVATSSSEGNKYEFPFVTTPDTDYEISVQHPDYETITSKTRTSPKVQLIAADTSSFIKYGSDYLKASLSWNDPVGENFYIIRVRHEYTDSTGESYVNYAYLETKDVAVNAETGLDGSIVSYDHILLEDKTFDGKHKQLDMEFYKPYGYEPEGSSPGGKISFQLISTNKETFLYYISLYKYNQTDIFSEPVKVFSNIQNGFGIFGTLSYSIIEI